MGIEKSKCLIPLDEFVRIDCDDFSGGRSRLQKRTHDVQFASTRANNRGAEKCEVSLGTKKENTKIRREFVKF